MHTFIRKFCLVSLMFLMFSQFVLANPSVPDWAEVIRNAEQNMTVARKKSNLEPEKYLRSLLVMAHTYFIAQEFSLARTMFWECFLQASKRNLFDDNDLQNLKVLMYHAMSSYYLGDYDECIDMFRNYLNQVESRQCFQDQEIISLCWMSDCYVKKKEVENAFIGLMAISDRISEYNVEDPYVLALAKFVEADYYMIGDPSKALGLLMEISLDDLDDGLETRQLIVANYRLLGEGLMRLAQFDEAAKIYNEVIQIMDEWGLNKGFEYFDTHYNLMLCQALDKKDASEISTKLNSIIKGNINKNFYRMTEKQRDAYWKQYNFWLFFILPRLASNNPSAENKVVLRNAYSGLLFAKGMLLQSAVSIHDVVQRTGNDELQEIEDQILYLKKKIQRWQNSDDENAHQEIFNIRVNIDRLQQRLLKDLEGMDFMKHLSIDVDSVKANLQANDVAVEFIALDKDISENDSANFRIKEFYAFVLKNTYEYPHVTRLCDSRDLDLVGNDLGGLYKMIWKPIEDELEGMNRIFFSPDDALYGLPVEYSILPDNGLLNEKYSVYRLSSTRELAVDRVLKRNREVGLFGDIDYFSSAGNLAKVFTLASSSYCAPEKKLNSSGNTRGASEVEMTIFPELPYSKEEIKGISAIAFGNDYKVRLYEKDNASEEIFKGISRRSPEILVVSTHGYVVSHQDSISLIPVDKSEAEGMMEEDVHLSRTGLVFAGANRTLLDESLSGQEDGFVSARDIAQMILDDTDLVLLSACDTGLGEISTEGIYGLQRGLKKAGVNSLLLSLWKVNDESTSLLMQYFFEEYLESGSKSEAMKSAIKSLRSHDGGKWDDPKYWASFILLDAID